MSTQTAGPVFTFRELHSWGDYADGVAIQKETWGAPFSEIVPASLLMISQKVGGISAGAFGPDGKMQALVYGLTGIRDGRPVHWSHMLAVRDAERGAGLGQRLKWYQRDLLLERGVDVMFWTFDPLVARNAHLNFNRLGAEVHAYVPDYYGADTDSELHSGLGTDRFILVWELKGPRAKRARAGRPTADYAAFTEAPVVDAVLVPDVGPIPEELDLPSEPRVRIEIPSDIQAVKKEDAAIAWRWRTVSRRAFQHYLDEGYTVAGLYRDADGRCFYALGRDTRQRLATEGPAKKRPAKKGTSARRGGRKR